jgi:signal peptidase II
MDNQIGTTKKTIWDYAVLLSIAGVVILLDQFTKAVVRLSLAYGEILKPELWLSQFARIVHLRNSGATNGIFQGMTGFLIVFPLIVSVVILYYFPRIAHRDWLIRLAAGMYMGGALGNLIDRLQQGYVTDFISIGSFPVFNIADASVSLGVATLMIGLWLHESPKKEPLPANDEPNSLT